MGNNLVRQWRAAAVVLFTAPSLWATDPVPTAATIACDSAASHAEYPVMVAASRRNPRLILDESLPWWKRPLVATRILQRRSAGILYFDELPPGPRARLAEFLPPPSKGFERDTDTLRRLARESVAQYGVVTTDYILIAPRIDPKTSDILGPIFHATSGGNPFVLARLPTGRAVMVKLFNSEYAAGDRVAMVSGEWNLDLWLNTVSDVDQASRLRIGPQFFGVQEIKAGIWGIITDLPPPGEPERYSTTRLTEKSVDDYFAIVDALTRSGFPPAAMDVRVYVEPNGSLSIIPSIDGALTKEINDFALFRHVEELQREGVHVIPQELHQAWIMKFWAGLQVEGVLASWMARIDDDPSLLTYAVTWLRKNRQSWYHSLVDRALFGHTYAQSSGQSEPAWVKAILDEFRTPGAEQSSTELVPLRIGDLPVVTSVIPVVRGDLSFAGLTAVRSGIYLFLKLPTTRELLGGRVPDLPVDVPFVGRVEHVSIDYSADENIYEPYYEIVLVRRNGITFEQKILLSQRQLNLLTTFAFAEAPKELAISARILGPGFHPLEDRTESTAGVAVDPIHAIGTLRAEASHVRETEFFDRSEVLNNLRLMNGGKVVFQSRLRHGLTSYTFSADGSWFIYAEDRRIGVVNTRTGQDTMLSENKALYTSVRSALVEHNVVITAVWISTDGDNAFAATRDALGYSTAKIVVFNPQTGSVKHIVNTGTREVSSLTGDDSGRLFAQTETGTLTWEYREDPR